MVLLGNNDGCGGRALPDRSYIAVSARVVVKVEPACIWIDQAAFHLRLPKCEIGRLQMSTARVALFRRPQSLNHFAEAGRYPSPLHSVRGTHPADRCRSTIR